MLQKCLAKGLFRLWCALLNAELYVMLLLSVIENLIMLITNFVVFEWIVKKSNEIVLVPFVETTYSEGRDF